MKFTAHILPGQKRGVATTTPMVQFNNIQYEDGSLFRDHAHIKINPTVQKVLNCMRSNRIFLVTLDADIISYLKRGEIKQETLSVTNIKVLGTVK